MSTAAILVGVLVGWASAACWRSAGTGNVWINRLVGVVGGLIGVDLVVTFGAAEPIPMAIWAWAGSTILSDLVNLLMGAKS